MVQKISQLELYFAIKGHPISLRYHSSQQWKCAWWQEAAIGVTWKCWLWLRTQCVLKRWRAHVPVRCRCSILWPWLLATGNCASPPDCLNSAPSPWWGPSSASGWYAQHNLLKWAAGVWAVHIWYVCPCWLLKSNGQVQWRHWSLEGSITCTRCQANKISSCLEVNTTHFVVCEVPVMAQTYSTCWLGNYKFELLNIEIIIHLSWLIYILW